MGTMQKGEIDMKNPRLVIMALLSLCVLFALVAFFLPGSGGNAFFYLALSFAAVVGALCIGGMFRFFFRNE